MKIKIWETDDFFKFIDGPRIDMDPKVVDLPDEAIAMVWGYDFAADVHAIVRDLRIEDGEIVGEATFTKPETEEQVATLVEHGVLRFGGYYKDVVRVQEESGERVTACMLKAVSILLAAQMPEAKI